MQTLKLRPYQEEAIENIEGAVAFGSTSVILSAETSFGKGVVIAAIAKEYASQGVMILVNIEPLLNQIAENLIMLGVDYSLLKAGRESEFDSQKPVQLVMAQTLYSRIETVKFKHDFYILQQDEGHKEWTTKRTSTILKKIKPDIRVAYSATPWDERGFQLQNSEIINSISCDELTKQNYLAPIKYFVPKWAERVNYNSVKKSGNDYSMTSLDELIGNPEHIGNIIESMNKAGAKNKKTLVFCSTIEMCDKIELALVKEGYSAAAYHSKKSTKENQRIMESFKNNEPFSGSDKELSSQHLFDERTLGLADDRIIKTLVSVSKLTTGFSVTDIDIGVVTRKTQVLSLWRQIAGRQRRLHNSLDYILEHQIDKNSKKIIFIASCYNETNEISKQLAEKKITNIQVLSYNTEPGEYDELFTNVRPNKTHGVVLDLAQMISTHGFPEELYSPPKRTHVTLNDKKVVEDELAKLRLEHLEITLDEDESEEITRNKYNLKIEEIKRNKKRLKNMTTRELSAKMELENDPIVIISIIAVLFDKIHNVDMTNRFNQPARGYRAKNGKDVVDFVNGDSIGWISELWSELLPKQDPYYQTRYLRSLRTRGKNMLKDKSSIWGLRFFITWLIEQDASEQTIAEAVEEFRNESSTQAEVVYEGFDITEDEIPF